MNRYFLLVMGFVFILRPSIAQEAADPMCGNLIIEQKMLKADPDLKDRVDQIDKEFNAFCDQFSMANRMTPDTVIIPMVFHIVHNNGPENVSDQFVREQVDILNEFFMAANENLDDVIDDFAGIVGNPQIVFRLAQYDPQGNCTSGITRTESAATYSGDDAQDLGLNWPRNSYLNVYIVNMAVSGSPGVIGYSRPPSFVSDPSDADLDGVVLRYNFPNFFTGSVLAHEAAHWLNIRHVWGPSNEAGLSSNCSIDDFVSDTPNTIGHSSGCNLADETCGSLDNIQNIMDYGSCPRMFTEGQANRMISALNSSVAQRNQLWTTSNLDDTGVLLDPILCGADFTASKTRFCVETNVQFTNQSYNGDSEWTWEFEGGTPATSDEENPLVTYNTPGIYEVSLTVGNGVDELSETKTDYIHVLEEVGLMIPFEEGFENVSSLPNENWHIESISSGGDDRAWEISNAASASGGKSALLKNYYQDIGNEDYLESNSIDLSGLEDVHVTFKYAYAKRHDDDDDKLKFEVTRTCGNVWITRENLKASDGTLVTAPDHLGYFTPESDEWEEVLVDNISSLYLIPNFRMRFEFTSGDGNNVYVDDINIFDPNSTGINEVNKTALKFKVFPNPADDNLAIQFNLLHNTEVKGEAFDISGRKIKSLFNETFSLGINTRNYSIQDWPSGVYFIKLSIEGENFIQKVIKK